MTVSDSEFRRLHPASPFLSVFAQAPGFVLAAGFVLFTTGLGRLLLAGVVVVVVARLLAYWRTTYCLTEDRLVVRSGWFQRSERVVSPDRLQQVEVIQALRHRALGVAEVKISLAGSTSVTLDSVKLDEADRIHDTLERGRRLSAEAAVAVDVPPPPGATLLQLDLGALALGAVTGAGLLVFPAAILALFNQFGDMIEGRVDADRVLRLGAPILTVVIAAACLLVAVALMWTRYYGYTLSRSGSDLRVQYGLLDRRSAVIPLRRVQRVDLKANALRRWAGVSSIDASIAKAVNPEGGGSVDDTVPVVRKRAAEQLLAVFVGVDAVLPAERVHPEVARRRAAIRRLAGMSPIGVVLLVVDWRFGVAAAIAVVLVAIVWADRWYRRLRHGASSDLLVVEQGVIFWRRTVQPWTKVQSLSVSQSPTQRRVGVLDLNLDIAGGRHTTTVRDISAMQAIDVLQHAPGLLSIVPGLVDLAAAELASPKGS